MEEELFVLLAFLIFIGVMVYFGAHRSILKALDARGEAIQLELDQAAKLRAEATALLASFERKTAEAEAKIALAEAQAAADVRAAAADRAAKAAEAILRDRMQGEPGAQLVAREIADLRARFS